MNRLRIGLLAAVAALAVGAATPALAQDYGYDGPRPHHWDRGGDDHRGYEHRRWDRGYGYGYGPRFRRHWDHEGEGYGFHHRRHFRDFED